LEKVIILGFSIAISPEDMTLEDFKYAVGLGVIIRKVGPNGRHTVGVHNGDYLIFLSYEAKFKESEARLRPLKPKLYAFWTYIKAEY
jgi:hypothetical protein